MKLPRQTRTIISAVGKRHVASPVSRSSLGAKIKPPSVFQNAVLLCHVSAAAAALLYRVDVKASVKPKTADR